MGGKTEGKGDEPQKGTDPEGDLELGVKTLGEARFLDDIPTGEITIPAGLRAEEAFRRVRGDRPDDPDGGREATVKVPVLPGGRRARRGRGEPMPVAAPPLDDGAVTDPGTGAATPGTTRGGTPAAPAGATGTPGAGPGAGAAPGAAPASPVIRQCEALVGRGLPPEVVLEALEALAADCESDADERAVLRAESRTREAAGDRDRAFFALVRAARLASPDRELLDELFRLAVLTGTFAELAQVYESALAGALPPADRIYLHLKLGHLYGRELARPQAAVNHYQRVVTVDPDNLEALRRLGELHGRENRWREVARLKQQELEAVWRTTRDVARAAAVKRELARICEDRLDDRAAALVHYRELLDLTPGNPAAIASLERLGDPGGGETAREAFETLRDLYRRQGAYARLADLLAEGARTALKEGRALAAAGLHAEAAEVYETHLEDPGRAFIEAVRAIQILPQVGPEAEAARGATDGLLEVLFRTGRASRSHAQLAAVAEDLALRLGAGAGAAILVRIAEVDLEDLGEAGRAASRLARAVTLSGNDPALESRLEALYVSRGAWRELADFYRARAGRLDEVEARCELLFRLAELKETELADLAGAAKVYEEIVILRGGSAEALAALCRLLEKRRDWKGLVEALERAVTGATDLGEKKAALLKRAEIAATRLQDPRSARQDWQRVLALEPGCVEALQGLADTTEEEGDARETATALQESLGALGPGAPGRADGYRRLARLLGDQLGHPARARMAWEEVLAEAPGDAEAFARLRALYHQKDDALALVRILRERLAAEPRHHTDAPLWRRELIDALASLGRGDEVGAEWAAAVEADPADTEAIRELCAFHTARRNWPQVARALRHWIAASTGRPEKADLYVRLAEVARHQQGDTEGAVAAYEKALQLVPDHPGAQAALLDLYRDAGEDAKAFPLMERRARRLADPRERAAALQEIHEVGRRLAGAGDDAAAARAGEALEEACLLAPEDDGLWAELTSHLEAAGRAADLAGLLEARAARLEGSARAEALLRAALAHHQASGPEDLRGRERARRCLERARDAAEPGAGILGEILGQLRAAYTAAAAWEALAAILEDLADPVHTPDPSRRFALLDELAHILEQRLGRPEEAARVETAMVDLDAEPEAKDALLSRLADLHGRLGDWPKALEILERQIRLHRGSRREGVLRLAAATIAERRIGDPDRAVAHLRAALARLPGDEDVLARLERACLASGRHGELAAILGDAARRVDDDDRRGTLLLRAAGIKETTLGDLAGARADLEAVMALPEVSPPVAEEAVAGLVRLLSAMAAYADLAKLYEGLAAATGDPEVQGDLRVILGLVQEEQLHDEAAALAAYRAALAVDPDNTAALDGVARLAEAADDLDTAIEMRRQEASLALGGEAQAGRLTQVGRLLEARGDDAEALAAYRAAAEADPGALPARRALLRLLRLTGDDAGIIEVARILAARARSGGERAALLTEVGERLEAADDETGAAEAFAAALDADPDHPTAGAALAAIHLARGDAEAASALLERAARGLSPDADRETLAGVLAQAATASEILGRQAAATGHLEEALRLGPTRPATLDALARLLEARGDAPRAYEVLRTFADHADDLEAVDRADLLRRTAACLSAMGRPGDAASLLEQAQVLAPGDRRVLSDLATVFSATGRWAEVVEVRERLRHQASDPETRRRLDLDIASVWAEHLHDAGRAAEVLERALAEHPDDPAVLDALAREQRKLGAFLEAAGSLRRRLAGEPDPALRGQLQLRLADLLRDHLDDPVTAAECYQGALELAGEGPAVEAALSGLRELAARTRDAAPLAAGLAWLAGRRETGPTEAALVRELAEVRRYQLGDLAGAMAALSRLLDLEPDDLKAAEDLARLAERTGRKDDADAAWRRVLTASPFDVDAYRALLRLRDAAGDRDAAAMVASLLVLVDEADGPTRRLAEALDAGPRPARALTPSARETLLDHPGTRGPAADLVAALGAEGASLFAPTGRAARLRTGGSFTTSAGPFAERVAEALLLAVRTLGIPAADLHLAPAGGEAVFAPVLAPKPVLTVAPEVVAGHRALDAAALRFHAARALMGMRPGWVAARVLSLAELKQLVDAAVIFGGAAETLGAEAEAAARPLAARLEKALPAERRPGVGDAARRFAEARRVGDLITFAEAVEHSAVRAGLLLAGTPQAAVEALRIEGEVARQALRELVRFAIDPAHGALRRKLGLTIA